MGEVSLQHEAVARWFVILAALALLAIFVYLIAASRPGERAGLAAALILTIQTIFFFIFYQQMPTSLALFSSSPDAMRANVSKMTRPTR